MSYCAEFVRFTVAEENVDTFLERRTAAIEEVKAAHPGLWSVPLCSKRSDGTWFDIWVYDSKEAAEAANADAENMPAFMAMAELLSDVDVESTEMPDGAISPLQPLASVDRVING